MKTLKFGIAVLTALAVSASCSKYDDSALLSEIQNLKDKIAELENDEFTLTLAEDTVCMANKVESFRSRKYEIPFTLSGAVGNVTVTADRNDLLAQDFFLFGDNLVFDSYGNSVEVVMDSKTSGKIFIIQDIAKICWSDGEFMVYYQGSVINVTAVDSEGRTCRRTIRLGAESIYSDYIDIDYESMVFISGQPYYSFSDEYVKRFNLRFVFQSEFYDPESKDGVMAEKKGLVRVDTNISVNDSIEATYTPAENGFIATFPIVLPANATTQDHSYYLSLYKYDTYSDKAHSASVVWRAVMVQPAKK